MEIYKHPYQKIQDLVAENPAGGVIVTMKLYEFALFLYTMIRFDGYQLEQYEEVEVPKDPMSFYGYEGPPDEKIFGEVPDDKGIFWRGVSEFVNIIDHQNISNGKTLSTKTERRMLYPLMIDPRKLSKFEEYLKPLVENRFFVHETIIIRVTAP